MSKYKRIQMVTLWKNFVSDVVFKAYNVSRIQYCYHSIFV